MPTFTAAHASFEMLESRQLLANVVWDGGPDGLGTDMGLAINWVGDTRPGPSDTAVVNTPGAALELDRFQPLLAIESERVINVRSGGTFITTGTSTLSANINLIGGALTGGTWNFTGSAAIDGSSTSGLLSNVTTNAPILLDTASENIRIAGTLTAPVVRLLQSSSITLTNGSTLACNIEVSGTLGATRTINVDPSAQATIAAGTTIRHVSSQFFQLVINIASNSTLTNLGTIEGSSPMTTITGGSFVNQGTLRVFGPAEFRMQSAWINQGTVLVTGGSFGMTGALDARAGIGDFRVIGTGVLHAGGLIDNTGNSLVFNNTTGNWIMFGATIRGGTLDFQESTSLTLMSTYGAVTFDSVNVLQPITFGMDQGVTLSGTTTVPSIRMLGGNNANRSANIFFSPGYVLNAPVTVGGASVSNFSAIFGVLGQSRASIGPGGSFRVLSQTVGSFVLGTDVLGTPFINLGEISNEANSPINFGSGLNNAGLLSVAGGLLNFSTALINTGIIRTTGGDIRISGTLDLSAGQGSIDAYRGSITLVGTINLGAGILTLDAVTGPLTMQPGAVIANGSVFTSGNNRLILIPSSSPSSGPYTTLSNIILNGTVALPTNVWLNLLGTTQSSPNARYELTGSNSTLLLANAPAFAGTVVALGTTSGERRFRQFSPANNTLTLAPSATIELDSTSGGQLTIGYQGSGTILNQGIIRTRSATQILNFENIFNNQGTVSMTANGTVQFRQLINSGIFSASTGTFFIDTYDNTQQQMGTMNLTGATVRIVLSIQNTESVFSLGAGSGTWIMQTGSQFVGGTVIFSNNAQLSHQVATSPVTYRDVVFPNGLTILSQSVRFIDSTTAASVDLQGSAKLYIPGNRNLAFPITASGASAGTRSIFTDGSDSLATSLRIPANMQIEMLPGCGGDLVIQGHVTNFGTIRNLAANRSFFLSCTAFDNQGLVEAASGTVNLSLNFQQRGTVRTLASGTLLVNELMLIPGMGVFDTLVGTVRIIGTINNINNTLVVNDSVTRWTFAGGTLSQGVVDTTVRPLTFSTTRSTLDRVTVLGDLVVGASSSVAITLGTTVTGAIRLTAGGAIVAFAPGYTLSGEIRAEGTGAGIRTIQPSYNSPGSFTIMPQASIRLAADCGDDLNIQGNSTTQLISQGTISNDSTVRSLQLAAGNISMPGVLRSSGGSLIFSNPNSPILSGTIFLAAGSLLQISATGGITFPATANITIELGSTPGPETGAIRVNGNRATLGGHLTLQKAAGADLPLFTTYSLVTAIAGTVQGSFASVTLPTADADEKGFVTQGPFFLRYTNTSLADFNNDLTVDLFDYLDFASSFAANSSSADINNDGIVDFFDYLDFVVIFSRF